MMMNSLHYVAEAFPQGLGLSSYAPVVIHGAIIPFVKKMIRRKLYHA